MHIGRRNRYKRKQLALLCSSQNSSRSLPSTSRATHNQRKNQQSQLDSQEPAFQRTHANPVQEMAQSVSQSFSRPLPSTSPVTPENEQVQLDSKELASQPKHDNLVNVQEVSQSSVSCCLMDTMPSLTHDPNQYRDVYDFLQASTAPMTHLMDVLIDFGCINVDFLRAMSKWPSERITYVLNRLGGDDRKLTGMEKFILRNHLKDYFA